MVVGSYKCFVADVEYISSGRLSIVIRLDEIQCLDEHVS